MRNTKSKSPSHYNSDFERLKVYENIREELWRITQKEFNTSSSPPSKQITYFKDSRFKQALGSHSQSVSQDFSTKKSKKENRHLGKMKSILHNITNQQEKRQSKIR